MRKWAVVAILLALGLIGCPSLMAQEDAEPSLRPNLPSPTLGGMQFWGDELFFQKWRIQTNVLTGHCRLLDEQNVRHAWGTFDECLAALNAVKRGRNLPPMQGRAVVVLHGLADTRMSMEPLCELLEKKGQYVAFNVTYPSTRQGIAEHAERLARILKRLDGIEHIDLVGHSLGNIVIRRWLADQAVEGRRVDARIKRIVMIGPPNHGSEIAETLGKGRLFKFVLGEAGQGLGPHWEVEEDKLAVPQCEFGIIAGGLADDAGFNPLLPGDDDGIVTVASTQLAGAHDFVLVPTLHAALPFSPKVQHYALRFFEQGYFVSPEHRRPIVASKTGTSTSPAQ